MKKTRTTTKTSSKQLKLSTATVRQLSTTDLDDVHGGHRGYTGACCQTNNCTH